MSAERTTVVLLHGLARGPRSLGRLAAALTRAGHRVQNLAYPSTTENLDGLLVHLRRSLDACCAREPRVHFVTYSMGGILLRAHLGAERPRNLGRVVMLAPPNGGTPIVDRLRGLRAFRALYGPIVSELGTEPASLPNRLGPPWFECGVIAGTRAISPLGWLLLTGAHDGTVPVASARLPGVADFITVPHSHTFLMNSPIVAKEVLHFIAHGRFSAVATRPA